jgi:hypothetical protein
VEIEKKDRRLDQKVRREFKKTHAGKRMEAELKQQMADMSIDVENDMHELTQSQRIQQTQQSLVLKAHII